MKTVYIKELKKRKQFLKHFLKHFCLKSIHSNKKLSFIYRLKAFQMLIQASKNTRTSQLKNRCLISYRSKAIESQFKVSRIFLRKLISTGLLSGALKSSW